MMNTIYFDSSEGDQERRQKLFDGQLFVFSPTPSSEALCEFARSLIKEAFGDVDPREAQHTLPVEEFAAILAELKPKFIHHPKSKEYIQGILRELQCDLDKVYFDVPRLRSMAHTDYLTSGIAYAFHPHRDTWFSAPHSQINWWIPVFDVESENVMAFHPRYWDQAVKNGSAEYNYYQWNQTGRKLAAQQIGKDTRKQPGPEEPLELDPQLRVVTKVGGILLFSGAQMHSTVPNTSGKTRFSIDFRTVHLDDLVAKNGAPNLDSACTGTTLRDFLRASDFSHVSEEVVALYDDETAAEGELVFAAPSSGEGM
jgi:hypothetical protein